MKSASPNPKDNRCLRQFADGRRCRMLRKPDHASLCAFHAKEEEQVREAGNLAAEFASVSGKYITAIDVNPILGKVFDAFAHKRISHRTANTFGYLGQLLLHSMPQVRREINGAASNPRAYDLSRSRHHSLFPYNSQNHGLLKTDFSRRTTYLRPHSADFSDCGDHVLLVANVEGTTG